jgi:hypothetical protein
MTTDNFSTFDTAEEAKQEAIRRGKAWGDIWCSMAYKGKFIAYELGFSPVPATDEDEDED